MWMGVRHPWAGTQHRARGSWGSATPSSVGPCTNRWQPWADASTGPKPHFRALPADARGEYAPRGPPKYALKYTLKYALNMRKPALNMCSPEHRKNKKEEETLLRLRKKSERKMPPNKRETCEKYAEHILHPLLMGLTGVLDGNPTWDAWHKARPFSRPFPPSFLLPGCSKFVGGYVRLCTTVVHNWHVSLSFF